MTLFEAIVLGLIQGFAEFFPVSSSGHLLIGEQLLGVKTDYSIIYSVILHIGTVSAVLFAYRRDVKKLFYSALAMLYDMRKNITILYCNILNKQDKKYYRLLRTPYRKLVVLLLLSLVPSTLLGFFIRHIITNYSDSFLLTGLGFLVTGLLLFVSEYAGKENKNLKNFSWSNAIIIGLCQGFSVIPGVSRFGMTMTSGMLLGFNKSFAVKYSFLLFIPTMIGAACYELTHLGSFKGLEAGTILVCIIGAIVAGITGYFTIKIFLNIIKNGKLRWISYYCIFLGFIVIIFNLI